MCDTTFGGYAGSTTGCPYGNKLAGKGVGLAPVAASYV
jgi:hypothetical protein